MHPSPSDNVSFIPPCVPPRPPIKVKERTPTANGKQSVPSMLIQTEMIRKARLSLKQLRQVLNTAPVERNQKLSDMVDGIGELHEHLLLGEKKRLFDDVHAMDTMSVMIHAKRIAAIYKSHQ